MQFPLSVVVAWKQKKSPLGSAQVKAGISDFVLHACAISDRLGIPGQTRRAGRPSRRPSDSMNDGGKFVFSDNLKTSATRSARVRYSATRGNRVLVLRRVGLC
jgi:hypothetical protein